MSSVSYLKSTSMRSFVDLEWSAVNAILILQPIASVFEMFNLSPI